MITGNAVRVDLRWVLHGQACITTRTYEVSGVALLNVTPAQLGEAWWNDVKGAWRALIQTSPAFAFQSVFVREIGGSLSYGEYAIPTGEQAGTRNVPTANEFMPPFVAAGVRLLVGTSVTRPGSMRLPGLLENDTTGANVGSAYITLANAVAQKYYVPLALGSPAAGVGMKGQVMTLDTTGTQVLARQDITSHLIRPTPTSQVSRKAR